MSSPQNNTSIKIPELLAPAGNMEKLITAIHYGADAVYLGGSNYSLRAGLVISPIRVSGMLWIMPMRIR